MNKSYVGTAIEESNEDNPDKVKLSLSSSSSASYPGLTDAVLVEGKDKRPNSKEVSAPVVVVVYIVVSTIYVSSTGMKVLCGASM